MCGCAACKQHPDEGILVECAVVSILLPILSEKAFFNFFQIFKFLILAMY